MEQPGTNAQVEACHSQGEEAPSYAGEYGTPKCHTHQLQSGLLKHVPVRLNGCIVYNFASEVGDQGLSQGCSSP